VKQLPYNRDYIKNVKNQTHIVVHQAPSMVAMKHLVGLLHGPQGLGKMWNFHQKNMVGWKFHVVKETQETKNAAEQNHIGRSVKKMGLPCLELTSIRHLHGIAPGTHRGNTSRCQHKAARADALAHVLCSHTTLALLLQGLRWPQGRKFQLYTRPAV